MADAYHADGGVHISDGSMDPLVAAAGWGRFAVIAAVALSLARIRVRDKDLLRGSRPEPPQVAKLDAMGCGTARAPVTIDQAVVEAVRMIEREGPTREDRSG